MISYVYGRGYRWLRSTFLPALSLIAERSNRQDRNLAADGYYLYGDVHDFSDAPRAAIRAYRECLNLDPGVSAAWREIGSMNDRIGRYAAARRAYLTAQRLDPEDTYVKTDLEYPSSGPPLFRPDDRIWMSSEFLASGKHSAALKSLNGRRSAKACQARARVHAAQGEAGKALEEWKRITRSGSPVEMESADWFYLLDQFWNQAEFWRLLVKVAQKSSSGGYWNIDPSLLEYFPHLPGTKLRSARARLRKVLALHVRYHLARVTRDSREAGLLARQYPKWRDVNRLSARLRKTLHRQRSDRT